MRRRNGSFFTGLVIGVTAGLMVGLVGVASSATGRKAWDRFGQMFQAGYVAGFLDCVRIAKGMDPESYVSTAFVLPPGAKPTNFQVWINQAYQDPKMAQSTVPQMISLAGTELQKQFGPEPLSGPAAGLEALRKMIEARRSKAAAEAAEKSAAAPGTPAPSGGTSPAEGPPPAPAE